MNELMLLSTMRMVREPGIFEPIAIVLGKIYNMLFNGIYGSVSAGALGIAIIVFTLIVKLILFPLMMKQQKSSFKMQQLQPEMNKIRDKYKGKTDTMSQQRMALELQDFQKNPRTPSTRRWTTRTEKRKNRTRSRVMRNDNLPRPDRKSE